MHGQASSYSSSPGKKSSLFTMAKTWLERFGTYRRNGRGPSARPPGGVSWPATLMITGRSLWKTFFLTRGAELNAARPEPRDEDRDTWAFHYFLMGQRPCHNLPRADAGTGCARP